MSDTFALSGLVRKRAELAGEIIEAERRLSGLRADLAHVDAAIRIFSPEYRLESIKAKRRSNSDRLFAPRELGRHIYDILRRSDGPMTVADISAAVIQLRGMTNDQAPRCVVAERIDKAIRRQGDKVERVPFGPRSVGWQLRE